MAEPLQVEVVAADRSVWSGRAVSITARTTEGDLGILTGHAPLLAVLVPSAVDITTPEGHQQIVAVDGGFISCAEGRVSILSEYAVLGEDIDHARAHSWLQDLLGEAAGEPDEELTAAIARARAQLAAAERAR